MLATLSKDVVDGPEWVFEEKYDGIRAIAERKGERVRLFSRTGQDLTEGFAEVVDAIRALPDDDLVLDGELVVFDKGGVSRFQLLQRRGIDPRVRPIYVVFDVLRSKGREVMKRPLEERRARLLQLIPRRSGPLMPSRVLRADGKRALVTAREKGWEGVIAKLRGSPYEPGQRSSAWRKVKVRGESEFVIGGYTQETLRDLGAKLRRLQTSRSPFEPGPRVKDAVWVRPELVAQIAYQEWTNDGKLRQPAFLGLRTDKNPKEVTWQEREP